MFASPLAAKPSSEPQANGTRVPSRWCGTAGVKLARATAARRPGTLLAANGCKPAGPLRPALRPGHQRRGVAPRRALYRRRQSRVELPAQGWRTCRLHRRAANGGAKNGVGAMNQIYPVLLSGGAGTRLWPLSRAMYPKQFIRSFNDRDTSFLAATLRRLPREAGFAEPTI